MNEAKVKSISINPLKKSQILGASIAFLGVHRCMPLMHGSQGCMAFSKNFLTQHFREITPMQSTALMDIATILGDDLNLHDGLNNVITKQLPDVVGLMTTGMTETRGDDIQGSLKRFYEKYPKVDTPVVSVNTPDFSGDAEVGYASAVQSLIEIFAKGFVNKSSKTINILAGMHLNAVDIDWIKRVVTSFGLNVIVLPDISLAMSGAVNHYYSLPEEGTTIEEIKRMGESILTIAIGDSLGTSAEKLKSLCGVPFQVISSLTGVLKTDEFINILMSLTENEPEEWLKVQRQRCVDAMLDSHFYFCEKSCGIAIEPDAAHGLVSLIRDELGIVIESLITTTKSDSLEKLNLAHLDVGDLSDFEKSLSKSNFIISNSNSAYIAKQKEISLIRMGFPIKDSLGHMHQPTIGYAGTLRLIFEIGNICLEIDEEKSHCLP